MNYFAHALDFLESPYLVAGVATPDWLGVVDRRVRVRSKHALPLIDDADDRVADVARGIVRHHQDDAWFHESAAFHELSWQLTVVTRDALPGDEGFRPSFLGHILVEILLDAELISQKPQRLEKYYQALELLDGDVVEQAVNRMAPRPCQRLAALIPHFCREGFLWDYADDGKLWFRLNQVMRRVTLPPLPESFCRLLPEARRLVSSRAAELLCPGPGASSLGETVEAETIPHRNNLAGDARQ